MIQPAGYYPAPMAYPQYPPVQQAGYTEPARAAAPAAPAAQLGQLMDLLRNSPYPAQRELAAGYLASCDWRVNPQIVTALIEEAKLDPAPTVRAGCVANLMRMNVGSVPYRAMLEELRTDADPRVRDAVEAARGRLGQVQTTSAPTDRRQLPRLRVSGSPPGVANPQAGFRLAQNPPIC